MRTGQIVLKMSALLFLAGCVTTVPVEGTDGAPPPLSEVPEGVAAIAAPNQNLATVRIQPEDGCYWYQDAGPVETTYLPLRSRDGRPICSRPQEAPAAGS